VARDDESEPEPDARSAPLSERDIAILAFERLWWKNPGAKEEAVRLRFGLSAARYYQVLGALIDSPLALVHDPMLIKRLHRMREARAEVRKRRTLQPDAAGPLNRGPSQTSDAQ
jgi:hypothetical protein